VSPAAQILIGVGAVSAVTTILAVIMVIADATIGNYGEVSVRINDEKDVTVEGGRSLLSSLTQEKIFIPSACGGRGSCGLCKVKVTSDAGDFLPTELPWLSDEEKEKNIRLSCQLKVKKDISIEIPDELFNVKEFVTEVSSIVDLTHDIKQVTLKLDEPSKISFKAGQFIQFEVPVYELTSEPVYRAYSIASKPSRSGEIELEIRLVPNGICTTYVFEHLEVGDKVTINGPYGQFYLRETEAPIIFVAGGSGNAPIKSILYDMAEKGTQRRAMYIFGARSKRDLFLVDEMKALEDKLADFTYIPALSQPQPEDGWEGETGRVTDVLERKMDSAADSEAYLCGSPGMIEAVVEVLKGKGMSEEKIYYDKFA
jgi:Na+-transporting NADH:ubiquinone oxidoreductase subunit F